MCRIQTCERASCVIYEHDIRVTALASWKCNCANAAVCSNFQIIGHRLMELAREHVWHPSHTSLYHLLAESNPRMQAYVEKKADSARAANGDSEEKPTKVARQGA